MRVQHKHDKHSSRTSLLYYRIVLRSEPIKIPQFTVYSPVFPIQFVSTQFYIQHLKEKKQLIACHLVSHLAHEKDKTVFIYPKNTKQQISLSLLHSVSGRRQFSQPCLLSGVSPVVHMTVFLFYFFLLLHSYNLGQIIGFLLQCLTRNSF